jgi:membrane protein YdbS with pleckstrin-like domain
LFLDDPADDKPATGGPLEVREGSGDGPAAAENVLWKGQASHHVNYGTYFLCALGAPLYFPAKWGIQRFRERNAVRYVITSRKVRVESGADHKQQTEIPLTRIGKVKLDTPPALEGTRACNISLFAADESLLTILEGVPLDEAARVISLCESAIHHQLRVDASARVLAHQRVEDEKARRRIESQRKWALASATMRAGAAEHRAREMREQVRRLKTVLGDDCPEDVINRSLAAYSACPPYQPRSKSSGGGWFGWLGGGRKKATWVRGFYRNGKWVKPYKRRKG